MVRGKFLTGVLLGFLALLASSQLFAQADVIEKRQALMKSNSAAAKAIKAAVESKDYATIETKAKDIMANAEKIPGLFPKGSTTGKTKAKAEIWEKPDEFAKNPKEPKQSRKRTRGCRKSQGRWRDCSKGQGSW